MLRILAPTSIRTSLTSCCLPAAAVASGHCLVRDMASAVEQRDGEIERLQLIVKQLQRARFGRRSERIDADQFALGLEDVETDIARAEAKPEASAKTKNKKKRKSGRKPLPD